MLFTLFQSLTQFFDPTDPTDPTFDLAAILGPLYLILIVVSIVSFIISLLIAIWVYKDAKKRDMNAPVWLLIVLLTSCIGCIIYLVVRD